MDNAVSSEAVGAPEVVDLLEVVDSVENESEQKEAQTKKDDTGSEHGDYDFQLVDLVEDEEEEQPEHQLDDEKTISNTDDKNCENNVTTNTDVENCGDNAEDIQADEVKESEENATTSVEKDPTVSQIGDHSGEEGKDSENEDDACPKPPHPYLYIVETFEFQKEQLEVTTIPNTKSHLKSKFLEIKAKGPLMNLLESLRNVKEIGLDVVVSYQEYNATVHVIQISTADTDYLLDAIQLKNSLMMLTEILINPKIVKIIFQPKKILPILQQQLHLFVVNVFDIDGARNALGLRFSKLNAILRTELQVERKNNAGVDIRKRPYSTEVKQFLVGGVHYLINLYHIYKNKLIEEKGLQPYKRFLEKCRDHCKETYADSKTVMFKFYEDELRQRHKAELDVLKKILSWRNKVAKRCNRAADQILHKTAIMRIVKDLPTSDPEIMNLSNGSPHVKKDIEKIRSIISDSMSRFCIKQYKKGVKEPPKPSEGNRQKDYKQFLTSLAQDIKKDVQTVPNPTPKPKRVKRKRTRNDFQSVTPPSNKQQKVMPWTPPSGSFIAPFGNNTGAVVLNPTTVPSLFTFQQRETVLGNDFSRGVREGAMLQMSLGNLERPGNAWRPQQNDMDQVNYSRAFGNNFSSTSITRNFSGNQQEHNNFDNIDQRINHLERRFQQSSPNHPRSSGKNRYSGSYKRRY